MAAAINLPRVDALRSTLVRRGFGCALELLAIFLPNGFVIRLVLSFI
jgi:hypothetical protein